MVETETKDNRVKPIKKIVASNKLHKKYLLQDMHSPRLHNFKGNFVYFLLASGKLLPQQFDRRMDKFIGTNCQSLSHNYVNIIFTVAHCLWI